jgi:hypothetical protein
MARHTRVEQKTAPTPLPNSSFFLPGHFMSADACNKDLRAANKNSIKSVGYDNRSGQKSPKSQERWNRDMYRDIH